MTKRRTTNLLAQLKTLASQAVDNVRERLALCDKVLEDRDWIAKTFSGDDPGKAAQDYLAEQYFADVKDFVALPKLLVLYRELDESVWAEYHGNLRALWEYREFQQHQPESGDKPVPSSPRKSWKKDALDLREKVEDLEDDKSNLEKLIKEQEETISQLRTKVRELELENASLEGRIAQLEKAASRQVSGFSAAQPV